MQPLPTSAIMESVRLPLHVGVDSLWRIAGAAGSFLPGVMLVIIGMSKGFPGDGGPAMMAGLALLIAAIVLTWLAIKSRASDVRLGPDGLHIEGGPLDGRFVRWDQIAQAKLQWSDSHVVQALELVGRDGQTLELAGAVDLAEIASLRALHQTIQGRLAEAAEPPPQRVDAALCRGCGAPLVPEDQPVVRCRACGTDNSMPPALRERVAAQRTADQALHATADGVRRLLVQPGASATHRALFGAGVASAFAWSVVLVAYLNVGVSSLDSFALGSGFFSGWCLTFAAFAFARIAMARRRALLLLSTTFGARPPSRHGEAPGCRQCGAPLPLVGVVARCVYCGTQSVLGIEVSPLLERVQSHKGSIEELLAELRAERGSWYKFAFGAVVIALVGGFWLFAQISVAKEFARDLKQCETGDATACHRVARTYFNGSTVKEDRTRSFHYYGLACTRGHAESCGEQGAAFRFGWGVPQNVDEARSKYAQACKLGHAESCENLKEIE